MPQGYIFSCPGLPAPEECESLCAEGTAGTTLDIIWGSICEESQNPSMVCVGRAIKDHLLPSAMGRDPFPPPTQPVCSESGWKGQGE